MQKSQLWRYYVADGLLMCVVPGPCSYWIFPFLFFLSNLRGFSAWLGPVRFSDFLLTHAFWAFTMASLYVMFLETSKPAWLYITHLLEAVTLWGWRQFWCCRGRGGWNHLAALWSSLIMPLELWTPQTAASMCLMVQENNALLLVDLIIKVHMRKTLELSHSAKTNCNRTGGTGRRADGHILFKIHLCYILVPHFRETGKANKEMVNRGSADWTVFLMKLEIGANNSFFSGLLNKHLLSLYLYTCPALKHRNHFNQKKNLLCFFCYTNFSFFTLKIASKLSGPIQWSRPYFWTTFCKYKLKAPFCNDRHSFWFFFFAVYLHIRLFNTP